MSNFRVLDVLDHLSTYHELHSTWAQSLQLWFTEQILGVDSMFRNDMLLLVIRVHGKGTQPQPPIEKYHPLTLEGRCTSTFLWTQLNQPSSANIPGVSICPGDAGWHPSICLSDSQHGLYPSKFPEKMLCAERKHRFLIILLQVTWSLRPFQSRPRPPPLSRLSPGCLMLVITPMSLRSTCTCQNLSFCWLCGVKAF